MSLRNLLPGSADPDSAPRDEGRSVSAFSTSLVELERELWAFTVLVMGLDVLLTTYGLQLGFEEVNPVARRALAVLGTGGLIPLKLLALFTGVGCRMLLPDQFAGLVPLTLAWPSTFAVAYNAILLSFA